MGFAVGSTHRPACNQASRSDGFRFALPILRGGAGGERGHRRERLAFEELQERAAAGGDVRDVVGDAVLVDRCQGVAATGDGERSEEHTSELQSLMRISYAVFCLKKKQ